MEENPVLPKEDAVASQVLETISRITLEALQTLEEPEERDVCSIDEGDDSVFYSDEDQAHKDIKANRSSDFVAIGYRRPFNSVASDAPIQQEKDEEGAEAIAVPQTSEEKEANPQVIRSEQEEECKELQQTDPADPDVEPDLTPESGGSLQLNTLTDLLTQLEENKSSFEENLPVTEEKEQTPNLEPFDASNEESNRVPVVPNQMSSAKHLISEDEQLGASREPEKEPNFHAPVVSPKDLSPGYSTLPLPKKSTGQKLFDHLTSSKYSTVSYRRIRRGNTRQKIDEFECMVMNL